MTSHGANKQQTMPVRRPFDVNAELDFLAEHIQKRNLLLVELIELFSAAAGLAVGMNAIDEEDRKRAIPKVATIVDRFSKPHFKPTERIMH